MAIIEVNFAGIEAANVRRNFDDMEEGIYPCITAGVEVNSNGNWRYNTSVAEGEYAGALMSVTNSSDLDKTDDKGRKPNVSFLKTALLSHGMDASKLEKGAVKFDPLVWFANKTCLVYFKPTKRSGAEYNEQRFVTPEQAQILLKQLAAKTSTAGAAPDAAFKVKQGAAGATATGEESIPKPKNGKATNPLLTVQTAPAAAASAAEEI